MNEHDQRIAIAEACGWKLVPESTWDQIFDPASRKEYTSKDGTDLPDYLHDLNAMHEVEDLCIRSLSQDTKYVHQLEDIAAAQNTHYTRQRAAISATAAQRAEAFLRTIGKWKGQYV